MQFKYLFTPLKIGPVTVPNRIYQAAHAKGFEEHVEDYALPGEREAYYHAERAKGGAGLLITGEQMVHPTSGSGGLRDVPHAYRREIVSRYRMIADMVHRYETKIFSQINHVGLLASGYHQDDFFEVWAPSALVGLSPFGNVKAMEPEDIRDLIQGFAQAAENARNGGLDGVEVHAAHGYLLSAFLSPFTNKRTDEYGGSLQNRMRLTLEVIDAVRARVGRDYTVGVRINGDDFAPGGMGLEEAGDLAKKLEATGKIDYISVSAGTLTAGSSEQIPVGTELAVPGYLVPLAAAIKAAIKALPVFTTGRINEPVLAERILAEGQADMVGMTRALIADPELPNKAREGRQDDIRNCIACNGCIRRGGEGLPITCVHNPAAGREKRFGIGTLKPAVKPKRVMVIGGGPAGLKAAEIAASRGHKVVLYEKGGELGGQAGLAAKTVIHQEFAGIVRYLALQINKLGVEVKLNQAVTPDTVRKENPDAVVVATGCRPTHTQYMRRTFAEQMVPGADQDNVVSVWDVLEGKASVGQNVVIVDGERHNRTIATADLLAGQGKKVEVITPARSALSTRLHVNVRLALAERLREKGVKTTTSTDVKSISGKTVTVVDGRGERAINNVDTVIWATITKPNDELYFALKGKVKELYRAGDCVIPRYVDFAIWEGEKVGRAL